MNWLLSLFNSVFFYAWHSFMLWWLKIFKKSFIFLSFPFTHCVFVVFISFRFVLTLSVPSSRFVYLFIRKCWLIFNKSICTLRFAGVTRLNFSFRFNFRFNWKYYRLNFRKNVKHFLVEHTQIHKNIIIITCTERFSLFSSAAIALLNGANVYLNYCLVCGNSLFNSFPKQIKHTARKKTHTKNKNQKFDEIF